MTRSEMVERMPAAEFFEWMLYEQIQPFGERRADLRTGQICATIANVNRGEKTEPYKVSDFMLPWDPQPELPKQSPEALRDALLRLQRAQEARLSNG